MAAPTTMFSLLLLLFFFFLSNWTVDQLKTSLVVFLILFTLIGPVVFNRLGSSVIIPGGIFCLFGFFFGGVSWGCLLGGRVAATKFCYHASLIHNVGLLSSAYISALATPSSLAS